MAIINIGGKFFLPINAASIDYKFGPYATLEEAWDYLGPDGEDLAAIGLTIGIQATPTSPITEYWFKNACDSIEDLVVKGGGGEPSEYIKAVAVSDNSVIFTKQDGSTVTFAVDFSSADAKAGIEAAIEESPKIAQMEEDIEELQFEIIDGNWPEESEE